MRLGLRVAAGVLAAWLSWNCGGDSDASAPRAAMDHDSASAAVSATPVPDAPSANDSLVDILADLGVQFFPDEALLEVSGWVNMREGLVEVFACAPEGKTHESVLALDCVPSGLHAGLLALGLEPGGPAEIGTDGQYRPPSGDPVEVRVRWADEQGREQLVRAEEWVWDEASGNAMPKGDWIFAGSFMQAYGSEPEDVAYAADSVKSLVTTYHDASSILENPHATGIDDTIYYSNSKVVPAVGTPVTVLFSRGNGK